MKVRGLRNELLCTQGWIPFRRWNYVKVYGIQRSATNWVKYLLENNFQKTVEVNLPFGDKHFRPDPLGEYEKWIRMDEEEEAAVDAPYSVGGLGRALRGRRLRVVVIIKPLIPWLLSYRSYRSLKAGREIELTERKVREWCRLWVERNKEFCDAVPDLGLPYVIVDYETLLLEPRAELERIAEALRLRWIQNGGVDLGFEKRMRRSNDGHHGSAIASGKRFDFDYYIHKRYLEAVSPEIVALAADELRECGVDEGYPVMKLGGE